jgi:tungstate transport system substrate-binding protein
MFIILLLTVSISFAQEKCDAVYGSGTNKFSLATGSPGELGILKVLGEEFAKENDASLCWVKAGSGDSLSLLKAKKADMIWCTRLLPRRRLLQMAGRRNACS